MSTAFAGRRLEYVDYHHLTEIPASIKNWKHKNISLDLIEENLHQKLAQRCTSDKQLYVEILRLFKDQHRRSGKDPDAEVGINKEDFHQLLTILGLFATREQSDEIFEKYDTNHSNNLSIHEFWVQCRPSDYRTLPGFNDKQVKDEMIMNRARKRMFIRESLLHVPVQTEVPSSTVYALPLDRILMGLRDKIRSRSSIDCTLSAQRTRHQLAKLFEDFDERQTGVVVESQLRKVLNKINYAVGEHYVQVLMNAFPAQGGTFDYRAFCLKVYPIQQAPIRTSGYTGTIHPRRRATSGFRPSTTGNPSYPSGSITSRRVSSARGASRQTHSRQGASTFRGPSPRPPSQRRVMGARPASRNYAAPAEYA